MPPHSLLRRAPWARIVALGLAASAAACGGGDDAAASLDAGTITDSSSSIAIAEPAAPALPVLTPCPAGWREVADPDGVVVCDPWPETGIAACAGDEAHFPGEPGCARIGTACPAGDWAEDLPATSPIVYVRGGATAGDGTRAAPYGTIGEAIARASSGTVIAVARGTYRESVALRSGQTLWGACVAETAIVAELAAATAAVAVNLGEVEVKNLRIGGATVGVASLGAARVRLTDVVVRQATGAGLVASTGGHITARTVLVDGTVPTPAGRGGRGVNVDDASVAELSRVVVRASRDYGVALSPGATMQIEDAAILDTDYSAAGTFGYGLGLSRAEIHAARLWISGSRGPQIALFGSTSTVAIEDLVVADGADPAATRPSIGMRLEEGAAATVRRALFSGNYAANVFVGTESASIVLEDAVLRDGRPSAGNGRGISIDDLATATLARVLVARNAESGVMCDACTLLGSDVTVVGTVPVPSGFGGRGIVLQHGANATLDRLRLERNHEVALFAVDPDTTAVVRDVVIRDTALDRVRFFSGHGVSAQSGGSITLERARISNSHQGGAVTLGGSLAMSDTIVSDTDHGGCVVHAVCGGSSIVAGGDGHIVMTRFRLERSELAGVVVAQEGMVDLSMGEVVDNAIGANVQVPGYDLSRLMNGVVYARNETVLDTTFLPIPDPIEIEE